MKKWPLTNDSPVKSILQELVETLTKNEGVQLPISCSGCRSDNSEKDGCNCTLSNIKHENTLNIYVILESRDGTRTQHCDTTSLSSNSYVCNLDNNEKIPSKQLCDGVKDCQDGSDESILICNSQKTIVLAICVILSLFAIALGMAIFTTRKSPTPSSESKKPTEEVLKAMQLIVGHVKNPSKIAKEQMDSDVDKMSKSTKIDLLKSVRHAEMAGEGKLTPGILIKTAVKTVFSSKSMTKCLLQEVKESNEPTIFKTDMFDYIENGIITRLAAMLDKISFSKVKLVLLTFFGPNGISMAFFDLFMVPITDVKDVFTIISFVAFYDKVIQQRTDLIGNIPLDNFVIQLVVIYCVYFLLKLVIGVQLGNGKEKYLHCFPFYAEAGMTMRKVRQIWKIHQLKKEIMESIGKLDLASSEDDTANYLTEVWSKSDEIHNIEKHYEDNFKALKTLTASQFLCDIMQAVVLTMLLLHSEERVRSLFSTTAVSEALGGTGARGEGHTGACLNTHF